LGLGANRANLVLRTGRGERMRIGIPKEIKIHEYRADLVPSIVRELIHSGHEVFIERGAGAVTPDREQAHDLQRSGATCIVYETVTAPDGSLPLLTPMSEVAGRMVPEVGASCLEKFNGGRGVLLGNAPAAPPADVLTLGRAISRIRRLQKTWASDIRRRKQQPTQLQVASLPTCLRTALRP
jgi:alanine dehydrogenase